MLKNLKYERRVGGLSPQRFMEDLVDYVDWKKSAYIDLKARGLADTISYLYDGVTCGVVSVPNKMKSSAVDHRGNTYLPFWLIPMLDEAWVNIKGEWVDLKREHTRQIPAMVD